MSNYFIYLIFNVVVIFGWKSINIVGDDDKNLRKRFSQGDVLGN